MSGAGGTAGAAGVLGAVFAGRQIALSCGYNSLDALTYVSPKDPGNQSSCAPVVVGACVVAPCAPTNSLSSQSLKDYEGEITVTTNGETVKLLPDVAKDQVSLKGQCGTEATVSATGNVTTPFTFTFKTVVNDINDKFDEVAQVDTSKDFVYSWTKVGYAEVVAFGFTTKYTSALGAGEESAQIICYAPASAGKLTIPASTLQMLPAKKGTKEAFSLRSVQSKVEHVPGKDGDVQVYVGTGTVAKLVDWL